jgi:hypothetical protein
MLSPFSVKTRQQVAAEYGVSTPTLNRWLKYRNVQLPSRLLFPKDLEKIYHALGKPEPLDKRRRRND